MCRLTERRGGLMKLDRRKKRLEARRRRYKKREKERKEGVRASARGRADVERYREFSY